jgi:hypothetical protein
VADLAYRSVGSQAEPTNQLSRLLIVLFGRRDDPGSVRIGLRSVSVRATIISAIDGTKQAPTLHCHCRQQMCSVDIVVRCQRGARCRRDLA